MLAELELSRVTATNELDDHLTSAVKEKYALSTAITGIWLSYRVKPLTL